MKHKPLVFVLFLLLFLLGAGIFSYSFFLPRYIEKKILPDLGRQLSGILTGQVYSIGMGRAAMGDIRLGDSQNTAVSIVSIHADYSIASLLAKKMERLRVNGLVLHLNFSDGKLSMPGLDLEKITKQKTRQKSSQQPSAIDLPIELANFQVNNGLVQLNYDGKLFLLPFDLQIYRKSAREGLPVYEINLQMLPQGEKITLAGIIDLADNKSILTLAADSLDLNRLAVLGGGKNNILRPGNVSFLGKAEISLKPFLLISANLGIDPELMHIGKTPVRFGHRTAGTDSAINVEIETHNKELLVKAWGSMSEPLTAALELGSSVILDQHSLQSSGNIVFRVSEPLETRDNGQGGKLLKSSPELYADFILTLNKSGTWKAELKSKRPKEQGGQSSVVQIQSEKTILEADMFSIEVHGQGTAEAHEVQLSLDIPKVRAIYDGTEISIPEASLQASYRLEEDPGHGWITGSTLHISADSSLFKKNDLRGKADISLQGNMASQLTSKNKPLQAEGRLSVKNAVITEQSSGVKLDAIEASIPWLWPQAARGMTGEMKIPKMRWKDVDLGSLAAEITLKDMIYLLEGNYKSSLLKGVVTRISGKVAMDGTSYRGDLTLQTDMTPFAAINLGKFDHALDKSYFSGELGLNTAIIFNPGGLNGTIKLELQNGSFQFPEKKYEVKGIFFSAVIPALPDLRTAPAQTLDFNEASIGNLSFSNGKIVWQLESVESVFLEEGVVGWAGGRVFTNAVRISPDMKEFVVPIFCDRLKLTELLHQFGISNAEGEGTVNGRIPLLVGKDSIRFEDGFLYSSPGQGGNIKVAAMDLLSAGIPKNTPQFAQIDFAAEALKNFQYNWVKLLLNSEGENLVMQMQMDGKPVQSLPFTYDSQTGLLKRTDESKQGINQPIRLDVNFRLPLNRFLGYSGKIQDIMKKIK